MALEQNFEPTENTRFFMTVYPWKSNFPTHTVETMFEEDERQVIENGLLSIQIHRSKENPYGTAVLNFFGPLPTQIFPGNWCLIKSYNGVQKAEDGVIRFFGQIYEFNTSYQVSATTGGMTQYTSINIREWSFLYSVPIRYDSYAQLNLINDTYLKFVSQAKTLAGNDGKELALEKIAQVITDPFEFFALTLSWMGALSDEGMQQIQGGEFYNKHFFGQNLADFKLPDVALLLPKIPKSLLTDLGVDLEDDKNPFASLVMQLFGVLNDSQASFDSSLGVFEDVNSAKAMVTLAKNRPLYSNIISSFVHGQSAWDILNQGCDRFVNEVFTDLIYYKDSNTNKIITRPLIMFRDKPFMMDTYKQAEGIEALGANWSSYDFLPRIDVPVETIERVDFSSSFTSSPNFIRVQYVNDGIYEKEQLGVIADINGTIRLPAEMLRYGGQTEYIQTPYTSSNGGYLPNWYKSISILHTYWNGLSYRMPNVQLICRDINICFTVGFNVRFTFNQNTYVGHLKNYSITYHRNTEGTHRTTTVLNLEKVVIERNDTKALDFVPELLNRDMFATVTIPPSESLNINAAKAEEVKAMQAQDENDQNVRKKELNKTKIKEAQNKSAF